MCGGLSDSRSTHVWRLNWHHLKTPSEARGERDDEDVHTDAAVRLDHDTHANKSPASPCFITP
jgi:hypothetical protein